MTVRNDGPRYELFFIQGADKPALVDPPDERRIDDKIRIGLFCLRVMNGNHIQGTANHLYGRCRHRLHCRNSVLIRVLKKFLARSAHVFSPDRKTLLFVGFKNRNGFNKRLQNSLAAAKAADAQAIQPKSKLKARPFFLMPYCFFDRYPYRPFRKITSGIRASDQVANRFDPTTG